MFKECLTATEEKRQGVGVLGRRNSIYKGLRAGTNKWGIFIKSGMTTERKGHGEKQYARGQVRTLVFTSRAISGFKQGTSATWSSSHLLWRPLTAALQYQDLQETGNPVLLSSPSVTHARVEGDLWASYFISAYPWPTHCLPGSVPRTTPGLTFKLHNSPVKSMTMTHFPEGKTKS